jgi:hypothetical protein
MASFQLAELLGQSDVDPLRLSSSYPATFEGPPFAGYIRALTFWALLSFIEEVMVERVTVSMLC